MRISRMIWKLKRLFTGLCVFPIPEDVCSAALWQDAMQTSGACTHPCRWKYSVVEESRPGEYMPVYENETRNVYF